MRIVCPICSAAYEVPDRLLVPRRIVRCARCGEQWAAVPVAPPPPSVTEPEPNAEPAPRDAPPTAAAPLTAMERLARQPAALPRRSRGLAAAWAFSLGVLVLLGWGFVAWRADIMQAWPPSTRLYDLLGLVPPPPTAPAPAR